MPRWIRRIVLLVCALSFVGGTMIGFAAPPAQADEPCLHEHQNDAAPHSHGPNGAPHHHGTEGAGCFACCLGACVGVPGLPPAYALSVAAPIIVASVRYWAASETLTNRDIPPDPAPPRSIV